MAVASLAILVPLGAATLVAALRPLLGRHGGTVIGIGVALAVVALGAVLAGRSGGPLEVLWLGDWRPVGGLPVGIALTPDPLGCGLALLAAVLTVASLVASWRLTDAADPLFAAVTLVLLAAMVAFAVSGDLFTLFVFFELMSVCAYALVGLRSTDRPALQGALTFAVVNSLGAIGFLLGISLLYGRTGALNLARVGEVLGQQGGADTLVVVAFALIAAGMLVKAAVVPFHFWLSDAYAGADAAVCLLLAGVFTEAGLFGLGRIFWTVFDAPFGAQLGDVRAVLVVLGAVTALLGGAMALVQRHLRRMLAFATIATVGAYLTGVGLLQVDALGGVAAWALADGLGKAGLFVATGILQARFGTVDAGELHGRGRELPVAGALFALGGLCIAGAPPLGPFWGKATLEHGAELVHGYSWLPWVLTVAAALNGAAVLRAAGGVFLGLGRPPAADESTDEARPGPGGERGRPGAMLATMTLLIVACAGLRVVPGLHEAALTAAAHFTDGEAYRAAVLHGATAAPAGPSPSPPSARAWALAVASTAGAVAIAWTALHRAPRPHGVGPHGARVAFAAVRDLHSGRVGDYVLWYTIGLVATGGVWLAMLT
jgi:multicomponent Na+:H+ antiporter subunit D